MELDCVFVSSRGLLKSCGVHSAVPMSSCKTDTQYLDDWFVSQQQAPSQQQQQSVYVCSDLLTYFVEHLELIKTPYVLVSGDSDLIVPMEALTMGAYEKLVAHPFLVKWFAQNFYLPAAAMSQKVCLMPIGLDYHTLSPKAFSPPHPWGPAMSPVEQEHTLKQIRESAPVFHKRHALIYSNVQYRWDRWGDRKRALQQLPHGLVVMAAHGLTREETWRNMSRHQFVLSPFGNGFDCHRTWEALALGCIPICCLPPNAIRFKELPILYVDKWADVTTALLKKAALKYHLVSWNMAQLTLKYWQEQFTTSNI